MVLVANGSFNPPTYMHLRMFGKLGCEFLFLFFVFVVFLWIIEGFISV